MDGAALGASFEAAVILITASTGLDIVDATRPAATLANDRNLAAAIGLALGSFDVLSFAGIYDLASGIALSSMFLIGAVLSLSYGRYLVAAYLGTGYRLPLRFTAFLEWCRTAGILRLSGAGYQFRHRELLDYLAQRPASES